jgi:hypothetical protein
MLNMFVLFTLTTGFAGEDQRVVYEFPEGTTEENISDYGSELAVDNAESYGHYMGDDIDGVEYTEAECNYEILEGSREEIEEDWGEICQA